MTSRMRSPSLTISGLGAAFTCAISAAWALATASASGSVTAFRAAPTWAAPPGSALCATALVRARACTPWIRWMVAGEGPAGGSGMCSLTVVAAGTAPPAAPSAPLPSATGLPGSLTAVCASPGFDFLGGAFIDVPPPLGCAPVSVSDAVPAPGAPGPSVPGGGAPGAVGAPFATSALGSFGAPGPAGEGGTTVGVVVADFSADTGSRGPTGVGPACLLGGASGVRTTGSVGTSIAGERGAALRISMLRNGPGGGCAGIGTVCIGEGSAAMGGSTSRVAARVRRLVGGAEISGTVPGSGREGVAWPAARRAAACMPPPATGRLGDAPGPTTATECLRDSG